MTKVVVLVHIHGRNGRRGESQLEISDGKINSRQVEELILVANYLRTPNQGLISSDQMKLATKEILKQLRQKKRLVPKPGEHQNVATASIQDNNQNLHVDFMLRGGHLIFVE